MSENWADKTAQQFLSRGLLNTGTCLILGAADTGKTTLVSALAKRAASNQPVAIVDADIGQSHIGPPTTVGWTLIDNPGFDLSQLVPKAISFVGDVTPTGHLLQLTAAITQCVQQASKAARLTIIDTPGFIFGPAANALWWTIQRILKPHLIVVVQRNNQLSNLLSGLKSLDLKLEMIQSPPQIPVKQPHERRAYRQARFGSYFQNSCLYNIGLGDIAIQPHRSLSRDSLISRLAGLTDAAGLDLAVGLITDWQHDNNIAVIRAPKLNISQVRCLVIGDVSIQL